MAAISWHREEPREVRPFLSALTAEDCLNDCAIRIFEHGEVSPETSFDLDEIDFAKLRPSVSLKIPDAASWIPDDLSAVDLELVLVLRHAFLKRSEVIYRAKISDGLPDVWSLDEETVQRFQGGRNLHITLALCLAIDRPPTPGTPFVAGHWLAQKTFHLKSRAMPTLFDLRTRTDEDWVKAKFPPKTFYSVEYHSGIDSEMEEGASVAVVYVHIDAHNKMVTSQAGESLQPILAVEIISAILLASYGEWKDAEAVNPASPLATLMKQLGKESPLSFDSLKTLVSNPPLLKATLQDRLSVVSSIR